MKTSARDFLATIQSKLPQAKLVWEKEPNFFFNKQPCTLTATSLADANKIFTMEFPDGLVEEPLDDVVEKFVDSFLGILKK